MGTATFSFALCERCWRLDEKVAVSNVAALPVPRTRGIARAMIGVFDSGHGGLTVFRALVARFPAIDFVYLGDHAKAPYGNRPSDEVVDLTRAGVETLFRAGARLALLACNTATCVAARTLQQEWLPNSEWRGHNVLGIVAPTVEAATQTPWAVSSPPVKQDRSALAPNRLAPWYW